MPIQSGKELGETIIAGMTADINDLPRVQKVAWFNSPTGAATIFELGKDVPFDGFSFVVGMFHDDETIRIYSAPKRPPEPKPDVWVVRSPTRYILTRAAATYVAEVMTLDVLASEIIDEWAQVADGMNSAEAEREAIISHIESYGNEPLSPTSLIEELRDEVHLDVDDGDDDEEVDEDPEAPTGVAAPSATVSVVAPGGTSPAAPPTPPAVPSATS